MITNEHLTTIGDAFSDAVLAEICEQYARNGQKPSEAVCNALARIYGKRSDEIRSIFELYNIGDV